MTEQPQGFAKWLQKNPEPTLENLVRKFGSCSAITREGWDAFDREMEDWRMRYRLRSNVMPVGPHG